MADQTKLFDLERLRKASQPIPSNSLITLFNVLANREYEAKKILEEMRTKKIDSQIVEELMECYKSSIIKILHL